MLSCSLRCCCLCRVELQSDMLLSVGLCRVELQPEMVVEVCLSVMTQTWRCVSWGACVRLLLRWILQDLQPAFFTPVSAPDLNVIPVASLHL